MFPPRDSPPGWHRRSEPSSDADAPVRATDNDAALARLSAMKKRYFTDPYISALVTRAHLQSPRPPLINIGTYLRGYGIDELVEDWFRRAGDSKVQIVSMGAGSDTRFWRLATGPHGNRLAKYIELDFPDITSRKAMTIRKSQLLSAVLGSPDNVAIGSGGTALWSPVYNLLPVDLRSPPSTSLGPILAAPSDPLLSPTLPTLLLFECVLAYIVPASSDALIQWFAEYMSPEKGVLGSIVYEMFALGDPFGRVMVSNLKSRNVSLPGVDPYPDFRSLPHRFLRLGFTAAHAVTLRDMRREFIGNEELERISRIEMLDEVEELELVLNHYAISWGVKIPVSGTESADWSSWGLRRHIQAEVDED
ncbi:leucine carboxyl methyltransferase [Artomyces pyxidatus]|uniref:Leucine carboxyl methyltransferase n=1 Tax=Artomyces pyxidatus TaxID=48021 RepID=A0ACB8SZ29_9AGAM|nr:leucine carboxyl methyltransferase [Artomyces pyxidatus]